ncbi:MAG: cytochrome c biogenesis protein CcsA [Gemmatimonadaceae bacterium]|jgi:heme exporter protein C|nr:cytochrome c biogenesis protein CcsA [Gemmatimonadaceae bacterium]
MAESTMRPVAASSRGGRSAARLAIVPAPAWLVALTWLTPIAVLGSQVAFLALSAPDRDMGHLQKIMYVHVPAAWNAFLAFLWVFIQSLRYLYTRNERADLQAAAGAEVGAVLTGLTLVLGSIWGRPTWGVWWTWDARLTSTAVLFLVYVGYLALRGMTDDAERRARWSAAVGILGALNVPIVYMSVKWWRTLHQMQSSPSTIDPTYTWGLRANAIAFLLMLIVFIAHRYRGLVAEQVIERAQDDVALGRRAGA